uniref:inorganic diphosphatase n=1 Tax=Polytomella parva TaxID=51329 RepID=A0A7S0YIG5_9CHLO|nr:inorganic pyrophosphatase chloroplastic (IPY3) [Polytomella parva]|mmetsp:Transcript_2249/g.3411  ORF Transcript_2249/g.3411 Transcript_2249/m.3411 type:complete len:282 (+) Transcript_2249:90-935(+)|eukprot:CAMPEP_0175064404 /NCGR_PEP_ID=MMETSP0052_2-20121109/15312_1 /TAXON_ID=51329 ORGANISM="Polytomella parva, Strain SAG 63-3" /NCGR_SAMPLE_ID=MMETSP0052_2 /ASSEMBLY_ACC=CAM_ASM_000194 /LENGTH=281 /DNA_ID=CAMNT_0016330747 /DNA_START=50 /DNA_END=895 /DNA_ORIENTATION=-
MASLQCAVRASVVQKVSRKVIAPVVQLKSRALHTSKAVCAAAKSPSYVNVVKGPKDSLEYRLFFKQGEKVVSPWHEIPLFNHDGSLNYICEIPRETSAKMEVATKESGTPIKQDVKKGKLRFYPYNINWNYGMLPQTWEDPAHTHKVLNAAGDNDPVDVVEISSVPHESGGVYSVKPVGVYAMIDDGELDWKVIAISSDDPKAPLVNDVADVEREFPGELDKILAWFRDYKIPDGKPANRFGFENKCLSRSETLQIVQETHEAYVKLKSGARKNDKKLSLI